MKVEFDQSGTVAHVLLLDRCFSDAVNSQQFEEPELRNWGMMKFGRIVYGIAAAYGFVSLLRLYFLLEKMGRDAPPPVTHPEFYYGFLGVTFLWQLVFVMIAKNPLRYRSLMPITILGM